MYYSKEFVFFRDDLAHKVLPRPLLLHCNGLVSRQLRRNCIFKQIGRAHV